jgi:small ligand-binding sensory domain FIST
VIRAGSSIVQGAGAAAAKEAARSAVRGLDGAGCAFVFASGHDADELEEALDAAQEALPGVVLVGCVGGGVVGTGEEVEHEPAISIAVLATDDSVSIEPVFLELSGSGSKDGDALARALEGKIKGSMDRAALVLLADPMAFDGKPLLGRLREKVPKLPVLGGLAASSKGDDMPVFAGKERGTRALAGAVLSGPGLRATVAVAQGTRPLEQGGRVTRAEKNLVLEVDGKPAIERFKEAAASAKGRTLFCGLGVASFRAPLASEDYLARNIIGVDPRSGAVAIAEIVPPGSTICFLARDAEAAREDLSTRVRELRAAYTRARPAFGLYFDCMGRGSGLYGEAGVDARIIEEELGSFPLAGFFGNGELAPFLGTNLVHNYTGALVLFGES